MVFRSGSRNNKEDKKRSTPRKSTSQGQVHVLSGAHHARGSTAAATALAQREEHPTSQIQKRMRSKWVNLGEMDGVVRIQQLTPRNTSSSDWMLTANVCKNDHKAIQNKSWVCHAQSGMPETSSCPAGRTPHLLDRNVVNLSEVLLDLPLGHLGLDLERSLSRF